MWSERRTFDDAVPNCAFGGKNRLGFNFDVLHVLSMPEGNIDIANDSLHLGNVRCCVVKDVLLLMYANLHNASSTHGPLATAGAYECISLEKSREANRSTQHAVFVVSMCMSVANACWKLVLLYCNTPSQPPHAKSYWKKVVDLQFIS